MTRLNIKSGFWENENPIKVSTHYMFLFYIIIKTGVRFDLQSFKQASQQPTNLNLQTGIEEFVCRH